jgi:hypothetical protein
MNTVTQDHRTISLKHLILLLFFMLILPSSMALAKAEETAALKNLGDGTFQELGTSRMWQIERSKRIKTPPEVSQYLDTLNKGTYSDWRLPTKEELYKLNTIFDFKKNGAVKFQFEGKYWLVNPKGAVSVGAWEIGDQCGPERTFYAAKKGYVRAIRP